MCSKSEGVVCDIPMPSLTGVDKRFQTAQMMSLVTMKKRKRRRRRRRRMKRICGLRRRFSRRETVHMWALCRRSRSRLSPPRRSKSLLQLRQWAVKYSCLGNVVCRYGGESVYIHVYIISNASIIILL